MRPSLMAVQHTQTGVEGSDQSQGHELQLNSGPSLRSASQLRIVARVWERYIIFQYVTYCAGVGWDAGTSDPRIFMSKSYLSQASVRVVIH